MVNNKSSQAKKTHSKKNGSKSKKSVKEVTPVKVAETTTPEKVVSASSVEETGVTTNVVSKSTTNDVDTMNSTLQLLSSEFTNVLSRLNELGSMVTSVKNEVRKLEKHATRELKTSLKQNNKRKRKTGNRSPSGFVKPTLISNELAKFLGKEEGSEMARTEVTKELNSYIRANKLQDKQNGRKINADKKLSTLLKLNKNDELTYFNLQRYMSPHFAKSVNKNVVVSTSST